MRRVFLPAIIGILLSANAWSTIPDPRKDFLSEYASEDSDDLIEAKADLNGDGTPEVLLSLTTMRNGRMGNIWVLYESLPDGTFSRRDALSDEAPFEFHRKATTLRERSDGSVEIVCYMPAGGGKGLLSTYRLGPEGITQSLSEEIEPLGDDATTYDNLFEGEGALLAYTYENAGKLKDRYFPLKRLNEKLSLVQKGLLVVGLLVGILVLLGVFRGLTSAARKKRAE